MQLLFYLKSGHPVTSFLLELSYDPADDNTSGKCPRPISNQWPQRGTILVQAEGSPKPRQVPHERCRSARATSFCGTLSGSITCRTETVPWYRCWHQVSTSTREQRRRTAARIRSWSPSSVRL